MKFSRNYLLVLLCCWTSCLMAQSTGNTTTIYYTTTDGEVMLANDYVAFKGNRVTNLYEEGRGAILFDRVLRGVGTYAFQRCDRLVTAELPDSVEVIGFAAFHGCSHLSAITLPGALRHIGRNAFWGCRTLRELRLPATVSCIERDAFTLCDSLTDIYVSWEEPIELRAPICRQEEADHITLHVPSGSKAKYESTNEWKRFRIEEE